MKHWFDDTGKPGLEAAVGKPRLALDKLNQAQILRAKSFDPF